MGVPQRGTAHTIFANDGSYAGKRHIQAEVARATVERTTRVEPYCGLPGSAWAKTLIRLRRPEDGPEDLR